MTKVPISGGGSSFAWDSAEVIALLVVGAVMMFAFFICEWKIASLPILPCKLDTVVALVPSLTYNSTVHLFRIPTVSIVLAQSFLVGAIYYGNIFYVPMFFQYVMGYSALKTGTLTLAYTLPQSLYGIVSGFIISKTNWYKGVIIFGSAVWTLGAGLQIMWTPDSSLGQVIGILEVSSIGVGCCLQSSKPFPRYCSFHPQSLTQVALVAMMAVTPDKDRAVVTSSRNFFRTMGEPDYSPSDAMSDSAVGGAFGLAIANALFNNRVSSSLLRTLSPQETAQVTRSAITYLDSADDATRAIVVDAYAHGLRTCFILFTAGSGACFLLSLFIKEVKFRKDPPGLVKQETPTARREAETGTGEKV